LSGSGVYISVRLNIAVLLLGFASANFCFGQSLAQVARGKVVSESGKPVEGVEVYGTKWTCCPVTVKSTKTKLDGTFSLTEPGAVLHFRRSGLEPLSLVIKKGMPHTVVLHSQQSTVWVIPACGPQEPTRFGQSFLFLRPTGESLAEGHDVDYTRFGVKGSQGNWLDAWFGPTAGSVDASEELYVKSESFSERFVEVSGFGLVGIDARGTFKNGKHWRWVGLNYARGVDRKSLVGTKWHWSRMGATDMIRYQDVIVDETMGFDRIINSVCHKS
jgi:hypothetical protein